MQFNFFFSPLEQFEVWPVWSVFFPFNVGHIGFFRYFIVTNLDVTCFIGLVELLFIVFLVWFVRWWRGGVFARVFYLFLTNVLNLVITTVGQVAMPHFGIVTTLFLFIGLFDVLGLLPFSFCVTSHLIVTQFLGFFTVGGLTLKGVQTLGWRWLNLFVPRNVPGIMLPFLSIIELISYISRALSLSIRLFANMVAGHALLHILIGALLNVTSLHFSTAIVGGFFLIPSLLLLAIAVLELGIAFLQAYVFVVLYLIYLNDAVKSH